MNLLDLIILFPVCYFAYQGFVNGFVKEVLSILGIILAVFLTFKYMQTVSEYLLPLFDNPDYAVITAGILLFTATVAGVLFIAHMIQKLFEAININFINRFAGLLFGALKSGIVVSAVLLLLAGFNLPAQETRNESVSYPYVIYLAPAVFDLVAKVYPGAENFIDTIEKTIKENNPIRTLPIFEPSHNIPET